MRLLAIRGAGITRYTLEPMMTHLDPKISAALAGVSTANITTVLLKNGLRNVWRRGPKPLRAGYLGWLAAPSPFASCRRARIWRRRNGGQREPRPANRDGIVHWTDAQVKTAIITGVRPDG